MYMSEPKEKISILNGFVCMHTIDGKMRGGKKDQLETNTSNSIAGSNEEANTTSNEASEKTETNNNDGN